MRFFKITIGIICFSFLQASDSTRAGNNQVKPPSVDRQINVYADGSRKLDKVIEKEAAKVSGAQDSLKQELEALKKKFAKRPYKYIYRLKYIKVAPGTEENADTAAEYFNADTVFVHDTIYRKRSLFNFLKRKKHNQQ